MRVIWNALPILAVLAITNGEEDVTNSQEDGTLQLEVKDIGTLTVPANVEPANAVENFAAQVSCIFL